MEELSDYQKYRGKCKIFCEEAIKQNPSLKLVRGHYICPFWGEQPHWWIVRQDGSIYDPTVRQFPTKGVGAEYIEFNGIIPCAECGKKVKEEDARINGNYGFCSNLCAHKFVGL
jgi:hypothetical protein